MGKQYCLNNHNTVVVGRNTSGQCNQCRREYKKIYDSVNRDKLQKQWKCYTKKHKTKINNYGKIYKEKYRDKIKLKNKLYRKKHKADHQKYLVTHKHEILESTRKYVRNKLLTNLNFKLSVRLRQRLYDAVKRNYKSGSAVRDLGCTINQLKNYLESMFQPGMTWKTWGRGKGKWNIDHILPLSKFDLIDRKQLLKVVHYTNLQPLWWKDNLKKGNKLIY